MTLLRDKAVKKLQVARPRLNSVKQITIARKYGCDELVKEPFEALVARKEVLSREEVSQLPLEDLHGLIVRREALQRENAKVTSSQCAHCTKTTKPNINPILRGWGPYVPSSTPHRIPQSQSLETEDSSSS